MRIRKILSLDSARTNIKSYKQQLYLCIKKPFNRFSLLVTTTLLLYCQQKQVFACVFRSSKYHTRSRGMSLRRARNWLQSSSLSHTHKHKIGEHGKKRGFARATSRAADLCDKRQINNPQASHVGFNKTSHLSRETLSHKKCSPPTWPESDKRALHAFRSFIFTNMQMSRLFSCFTASAVSFSQKNRFRRKQKGVKSHIHFWHIVHSHFTFLFLLASRAPDKKVLSACNQRSHPAVGGWAFVLRRRPPHQITRHQLFFFFLFLRAASVSFSSAGCAREGVNLDSLDVLVGLSSKMEMK